MRKLIVLTLFLSLLLSIFGPIASPRPIEAQAAQQPGQMTSVIVTPKEQAVLYVVGQGATAGYALRFQGNGVDDIDRVKIQIDDPNTNDPGPPADIGAEDFTLEFWLKGNASENGAGSVSCGSNINWIYGNIIFDRDRYSQDRKFGLSIAGNRLVFGMSGDSTGDRTICGSSNVLDGAWHHIAIQRRRSDGRLWLYVDGTLEAEADGPNGDVSYPDDGVPQNYCGGPCTNSDPYLVIAAEKHDAGSQFPSFSGWVDEVRLSNMLRYGAAFSRPTAPFSTDSNTVALYHFDEGSGNTITDSSGAGGGPSNGVRRYGGSPAGPEWAISDAPLTGASMPTPTNTPVLPTVTPVPPTATPIMPTATTVLPTNTPLPPTATPNAPTNTPVPPTNTPVPPTATATTGASGNRALLFDGSNDRLLARQVPGTGPLTIEGWVQPSSNNGNGLLIVGADDNTGWSLELEGGRLTLWLATSQGWRYSQHGTALQSGQWYHVAATYNNNGSVQLFVDGSGSGVTNLGSLTQGPILQIGGRLGYSFYGGVLDEVRISNTIRYSGNFSRPTAPFANDGNTLTLYHFEEGSGQLAGDGSSAGNGATLGTGSGADTADPSWVPGYPFAPTAPTGNDTITRW